MSERKDIIPGLCECGRPNRHGGEKRSGQRYGCARCIELEDKMHVRKTTSGIREGDSRFRHREINAACDHFMRARGIPVKKFQS